MCAWGRKQSKLVVRNFEDVGEKVGEKGKVKVDEAKDPKKYKSEKREMK